MLAYYLYIVGQPFNIASGSLGTIQNRRIKYLCQTLRKSNVYKNKKTTNKCSKFIQTKKL